MVERLVHRVGATTVMTHGAPKHIEWGDRLAHAVSGAAADTSTIESLTQLHPKHQRPNHWLSMNAAFGRLRYWLKEIEQVRNEIINSGS